MAMKVLQDLVHRTERLQSLDRLAEPLKSAVGRLVRPRAARNLLSGTGLGHPLHPMLTDLPIGAWTMATFLDTFGGRSAAPAADVLVSAGIVAAVPTAMAGLNDWSDTYGAETRVGLVHAATNTLALGLYTASLVARRCGRRSTGRMLGWAGFAAMAAGGYLGGHLSFAQGVKVNRTAWREGPSEWTPVLADADLAADQAHRVDVDGVSILLYRTGTHIQALDSVCTHAGGPLDEGTIADGYVTCPWHGSVFCLENGAVDRGPATSAQPSYQTRIRAGQIEVRAQQ